MRRVEHIDRMMAWLAISCLWVAAWPPRAAANAPHTIPFQGILASAMGVPKPNGTYSLTFRLYDAVTGGNLLWTEPGKSVNVSGGKGLFSTTLGEPTSISSLTFNKPYWFEVQVSGEAPMTPRLPLQAAPYAIGLALPLSGSAAMPWPSSVLSIENSDTGTAVQGVADGLGGIGVAGYSTAEHGYGVYGYSPSDRAVFGQSDTWEGVHGESRTDKGVYGGSDTWVGVWGHSNSSTGVRGESTSGYGVQGQSSSSTGVLGQSDTYPGVWGQTGNNSGVVGESTTGNGVYGVSDTDGLGHGENGVYGRSNVALRGGVYGENPAAGGYGAYGNATGFNGIGVYGTAPASSGSRGVYGTASTGYGVYGSATDGSGAGVYGESARGAHGEIGTYYGGDLVWFAQGHSVGAEQRNFPVGVLGASPAGGVGVMGIGDGEQWDHAPAGAFIGNVVVTGDVFYDRAFAPPPGGVAAPVVARALEGPEPLDVCSGNVTLDDKGEATVDVPDSAGWTSDVRYSLTPIGSPAPGLYIAEKVHDGHFRIAGGPPGLEISWQVFGVRS